MNNLPNYDQIVALHKKYAPSDEAFNLVFTHCQIVWEVAEQLIERSNLQVDLELVKVGCLLHDIGVYHLYLLDGSVDFDNYVSHGYLGGLILKKEGFSDQICRIASCHTGMGLCEADIVNQAINIPIDDYLAVTIEERLVMYADKFHSKSTPPVFNTAESYSKSVEKFGRDKVEHFDNLKCEFGIPDLTKLAEKYGFEII